MTADNEQFLIDINNEIEKFDEFLKMENNDKIFFSGKFGIGKTFFLREFAKQKNDDYLIIHLFPVNYQTRNNYYDIVDLLKYDILTEILSFPNADKFIDVENKNLLSYVFNQTTLKEFLGGTLSLLGEITFLGKVLGKPLIKLLEIDEKYQKEKNEKVVIDNFLKITQNEKIVEDDVISQIIRNILGRIDKKTVLILDDLDRIDPDNIFRILNVFSSFYDREEENKFGFDKIIVVGDYENLRNIFHHKYGENTNFEGYMDKFFSIEPYRFMNLKSILDKLNDILAHLLESDTNQKNINDRVFFLIKFLFLEMLYFNLINLRELLKSVHYNIRDAVRPFVKERDYENYFRFKKKILLDVFKPTDEGIQLLISILGGKESFLQKLKKLKDKKEEIKKLGESFSRCDLYKLKPPQCENYFKFFLFLFSNMVEKKFFEPIGTFNYYFANSLSIKVNNSINDMDIILDDLMIINFKNGYNERPIVSVNNKEELEKSFLFVLYEYVLMYF